LDWEDPVATLCAKTLGNLPLGELLEIGGLGGLPVGEVSFSEKGSEFEESSSKTSSHARETTFSVSASGE